MCEVERQEARVEVQGPKRKVIRMESEETQDYVRKTLAISQEEADEIGIVPSSCSSSLAHDTGEAMSASSRHPPSIKLERDWWSADLEGEMEKLEVDGSFPWLKADPWISKGRRSTGQLRRCLQKKKVKK